MKSLNQVFTEHPASVNETYGEHLSSAWSFAGRMIGAGLACFLHGLFPFLHVNTASRTIRDLHDRMSANRIHQEKKATNGVR